MKICMTVYIMLLLSILFHQLINDVGAVGVAVGVKREGYSDCFPIQSDMQQLHISGTWLPLTHICHHPCERCCYVTV